MLLVGASDGCGADFYVVWDLDVVVCHWCGCVFEGVSSGGVLFRSGGYRQVVLLVGRGTG